jgi:hypothetical protein
LNFEVDPTCKAYGHKISAHFIELVGPASAIPDPFHYMGNQQDEDRFTGAKFSKCESVDHITKSVVRPLAGSLHFHDKCHRGKDAENDQQPGIFEFDISNSHEKDASAQDADHGQKESGRDRN